MLKILTKIFTFSHKINKCTCKIDIIHWIRNMTQSVSSVRYPRILRTFDQKSLIHVSRRNFRLNWKTNDQTTARVIRCLKYTKPDRPLVISACSNSSQTMIALSSRLNRVDFSLAKSFHRNWILNYEPMVAIYSTNKWNTNMLPIGKWFLYLRRLWWQNSDRSRVLFFFFCMSRVSLMEWVDKL